MALLLSLALWTARKTPVYFKQYAHRHRILDGLTRKMFSSFLQAGGQVATIASGPLEGLKLAVSQHTSHAHIGGTYEIHTQLAVDRCVKPGFVCYDLGASIGFLTLVMARKASHVFSFAPAPHAAGELNKQIAINNFENVTIVPRPISDCDREVQFALTDVAYGSAIVTNSTKWPTLTLRTMTLDEFTHSFPDFVKIDVDGEEGRVLAGARKNPGTAKGRFLLRAAQYRGHKASREHS